MRIINIKLTFSQLASVGVHIGHTLEHSEFLTYWIYGGWRKNIFIINLIKTYTCLKLASNAVMHSANTFKPIWFININKIFGPYIFKFAMLCGEPFFVYSWISGSLTNFRRIFEWHYLIFKILSEKKYKLRYSDIKRMYGYRGLANSRRQIPGVGFVTNVNESKKVVTEFAAVSVPCIGIVDSDVLSWEISLPIPGNDDSLICLNYYCYFFSRIILTSKMSFVNKFKNVVLRKKIRDDYLLKKKLVFFYLYNIDIITYYKLLNESFILKFNNIISEMEKINIKRFNFQTSLLNLLKGFDKENIAVGHPNFLFFKNLENEEFLNDKEIHGKETEFYEMFKDGKTHNIYNLF